MRKHEVNYHGITINLSTDHINQVSVEGGSGSLRFNGIDGSGTEPREIEVRIEWPDAVQQAKIHAMLLTAIMQFDDPARMSFEGIYIRETYDALMWPSMMTVNWPEAGDDRI